MTASEGSFLGFAPQVSKGNPNRTSADFKYLLFRQGQAAPQSITVPLDPEVGGGAMLRSVAKMGVSAAAAVDFVPRPASLGMFLKGATGFVKSYKNLVSVMGDHQASGVILGAQRETATATGNVGAAGAGSYLCTITKAGFNGGVPLVITTAVGNDDTPTVYCAKVRVMLNASATVTAYFDVGTAVGATIVLTCKTSAADDGTFNIALAKGDCTGPDDVPTSANTWHGHAISNQPESATKLWVKGSGGVAGNVVINVGLGDTETIALTGAIVHSSIKTFKTVTKLQLPPTPTGSTTTTITTKDGAGNTLLAAQTLTAVRQSIETGFGTPTPASVLKFTLVSDQHVYGSYVRVWGTDATDDVIDEVVYLYPYEMIESAATHTTITTISVPTDVAAEKMVAIDWHDGSYTHEFTLSQWDNFDAPWYTLRNAPGGMWGEEYVDGRINTLGLEFRAAQFLGGAVGAIGITPSRVAGTGAEPAYSNWNALDYVDSGPQFIAPLADIELPSGTNVCVLQGTFAAAMQIPLDEQFCVGSYYPESLDIVGRQFSINLLLKITSDDLPTQMFFDPSYAGSDAAASWVAEIFRNANFKLEFSSDQDAATIGPLGHTGDYRPYKLNINGNLLTGDSANVLWTAAPIPMRAQRQVLMNISGMFVASPVNTADPIKFTLVNRQAYY